MTGVDALIPFLPASDLDATERFYRELIGLRLTLDQGRCRIFEVNERAHLGFCQSDEVPRGGRIILTLVVDDPDAWCDRLRGVGLSPGPVRESEEYRIRHFFVPDPDGYLVEFQRFWDADWREGGGYRLPRPPLA